MTKRKKNDSITLSPKHGVNPSITHCFVCGKEIGIALFGKLKDDAEAPKDVFTGELCEDCQKIVDNGNKFLIELTDTSSEDNPQRTGRYVAVKGESLFEYKAPIIYCRHSVFEQMFGEAFNEENKEEQKNAN